MPDPIRVTRAVRRCDLCGGSGYFTGMNDPSATTSCPDCTDGWVDVPVDEECPTGMDHSKWKYAADCPDCDGSGRRLHDWATGWRVGDEVLVDDQFSDGHSARVASHDVDGIWEVLDDGSHASYVSDPSKWTLVLSDPSHRPEPLRWKQ